MKLADMFMHDTRNDGTRFVRLVSDDEDCWMRAAIYEAHGDMGPNDWIYEECYAAACAIDDGGLDEDDTHSHVDGQVEVYTQKLYQWAADFCLSSLFAEADDECEFTSDDAKMHERIQRIQYYVIDRIAGTILRAWQEEEKRIAEASYEDSLND